MTNPASTSSIPGSTPRTGESTGIWLVKLATGPLLVLVLLLHLIVNHYVGTQGGLLTYDEIVRYYQNPLIPLIEIIFLITVVTHSLIGLRGILLDLNPSRGTLKTLTWVLWLVGVASVVYGTWLALVIAGKGG